MTKFLQRLRFYLAVCQLTTEEVDKIVNDQLVKRQVEAEDVHGVWEELGTAVSFLDESAGTKQFWIDRREPGERMMFIINLQGT